MNKFSGEAWNALTYEDKIRHWLADCDGKMPTYDALINNLVEGIKNSGSKLDGGNHVIEFPVPAVFYDHELKEYRPDYEYETFMFNRLLGELDDEGLVTISTDTQILGKGNDTSEWRPYIVTKVAFELVDKDSLLSAIEENKEDISNSVIANLVSKIA